MPPSGTFQHLHSQNRATTWWVSTFFSAALPCFAISEELVMASPGGRPWGGKDLKAPVALALVVLALAVWKVGHIHVHALTRICLFVSRLLFSRQIPFLPLCVCLCVFFRNRTNQHINRNNSVGTTVEGGATALVTTARHPSGGSRILCLHD